MWMVSSVKVWEKLTWLLLCDERNTTLCGSIVAESVASGEIGRGIGDVGRQGLDGRLDEHDNWRGGKRVSDRLLLKVD